MGWRCNEKVTRAWEDSKAVRGGAFNSLRSRILEKRHPRKNGRESWQKKKAAWEEKTTWEREGELPENGEILLICRKRAELEANQLLTWWKPSRYNYYELLISHLHIDSLSFLTVFLGIDLFIDEAFYHVHYEASRDIGCIFIFESVCDFSTGMSPLSDHEMWLPLVFSFSFFYFLCSVFLVVFLCFSVGILGAWLYGYHQVTMTGKGFWMLLRLGSQIQKEESRLNGSSHWCFKRKLIWDPTIISVFACIRYSNSVATTICVAKIPTFSALF